MPQVGWKSRVLREVLELELDTGLAAAGEKKEEPSKVESPRPWPRLTTGKTSELGSYVFVLCYWAPRPIDNRVRELCRDYGIEERDCRVRTTAAHITAMCCALLRLGQDRLMRKLNDVMSGG